MHNKHDKNSFLIPAVIFAVAVSIVGGFLAVQGANQLTSSGLTATSAAIGTGAPLGGDGALSTTGGVLLNTAGAADGLIVQSGNVGINGNVGIGRSALSGYKLIVEHAGTGAGIYSSITGGGAYTAINGSSNAGTGVNGWSSSGNGIVGTSATGYAGYFNGNVTVTGGMQIANNIRMSSGKDILVSNYYPLTSTVYINSNTNGEQVWSSNALTIDDTTAGSGWYWHAPNVSVTLTAPALGFKLRGSSDDGGVCQIYVTNLFAANITNNGYTSAYDLSGAFPAGGLYANSGSGSMPEIPFLLAEYERPAGAYYNIQGNSMVDNSGYIRPYGLNMIPAGRTVVMRGGRNDGGGSANIRCYLDILYATQYKPE